jgi:hypothetical protein
MRTTDLAASQRGWQRTSRKPRLAAVTDGVALAHRHRMRTSAVIAMALLGACTIDDRSVQLPEEPTQHSATYFDIPVGVARETDILVVVDNSPAMAPHAARVMPLVAKTLAHAASNSDPDWHLGVITSDLGGAGCSERGDDGLFRSDGLVGSPFLIEWRHLDQRHTANYEGEFEDAFTRLVAVGTEGCARQQPLAAIRRALAGQPRNAGFRREGANLIIFVVSAQDDGSVDVVADDVAFLTEVAPDGSLFLAGIYDRPAPRLDELFTGFPNRAFHSMISQEDPFATLWLPFSGGRGWGGVPCLEGTLGPTPECSISDVIFDDDERVYESVLQRCDAGDSNKPCWHIETDRVNCPSWSGSQNQVLEIERRDYPPVGTHVIGNCVSR